MIAVSKIRERPCYRRDAFETGLRACGFDVRDREPGSVRPGDVLVLWNRYASGDDLARWFERHGAQVLIAENGYVGLNGQSPHSMEVRDPYALARSYHNDDTTVPGPAVEKWCDLNVDVMPWRKEGRHVLIMPNRSFGTPGRIMPQNWAAEVERELRKHTKREIRIRNHPGNAPPTKPLADDLRDCHAAVIWNSSAGVHALIQGVPVISMAPNWIMRSVAGKSLAEIEAPPMPERIPAFHRLAAAQSSIADIASGEAFRRLLA